jgi:hypothetical protein
MTAQEVAVHQLCPVFLLGEGGSPAPLKDLDDMQTKIYYTTICIILS